MFGRFQNESIWKRRPTVAYNIFFSVREMRTLEFWIPLMSAV